MQLRDNFAIALLLQSTVSLATALVSAHLENSRSISQSNTVLKKNRKRPLLKFLKRPRPLLGLEFDLFSCFLFPISDHSAAWVAVAEAECHLKNYSDHTSLIQVTMSVRLILNQFRPLVYLATRRHYTQHILDCGLAKLYYQPFCVSQSLRFSWGSYSPTFC